MSSTYRHPPVPGPAACAPPLVRRAALLAVLLVAPPMALPASVPAAVIHVPAEQPTIQAGINAAAAGDTVLVAAGTYQGSGNRDLNFGGRDLMLLSETGAATTIIDCQSLGRGFVINQFESSALVIDGFQVMHGFVDSNGGGLYCVQASPQVRHCIFANNRADSGGGAWCSGGGATFTSCVFRDNYAGGNSLYAGHGGGLWSGTVAGTQLDGCQFIDNEANRGGGLWASTASSPVLVECTFEGNVARSIGGGMMSFGMSASPTLTHCVFASNSASSAGGGYFCLDSAPVFEGCLFRDNWGGVRGGGLLLNGSTPSLSGTVFSGNGAAEGGAIECFDSAPWLSHCTLYGNEAPAGGGIDVTAASTSSDLVAENTIIAFGTLGEAVHCSPGASASLSCSDIFANAGGDWTGCIADQVGTNGNFTLDPLFCDAAGGDLRVDASSPCAPEHSPGQCGLIGALPAGCGTSGIAGGDPAPAPVAGLLRARPNPLRAGGVIEWWQEEAAAAVLRLYDAQGRLRARHPLGTRGAGWQQVAWEQVLGGRRLPAGVYFLQLDGAGGRQPPLRIVWTR